MISRNFWSIFFGNCFWDSFGIFLEYFLKICTGILGDFRKILGNSDFWGIFGNWLKMGGTICFFIQDFFVYVMDPVEGPVDKCFHGLLGIFLFFLGGVVHMSLF